MQSSKVTSKGQITLPVEMRTEYGIETGDEIVFFRGLDNRPSFYVRQMRGGPIEPLSHWDGPPVTVAEMDESISEAIAEDYSRSVGQSKKSSAS